MPQHENAHIIRTSDRKTFKTCRQQWDFGSKIRQNYEPNTEAHYLAIGTALHAGLETYYEPTTWSMDRKLIEPLAIAAFLESFKRPENVSDDALLRWEEQVELGQGMLRDYFKWAPAHDKFKPVYVEIEFEVPVLWDSNVLGGRPDGFHVAQTPDVANHLYYGQKPVYYQGRLDMIVEDEYGNYWIWDHKNVASLGSTEFLNMDEQCGSYMWAIQQMLGIKIYGVIYNELVKTNPHPPKVLKAGTLSVAKDQNTTLELFEQEMIEHPTTDAKVMAKYQEMLDHLRMQGNKFIRRTQVHRSQRELENLGNTIALEAVDMLNSPSIYPRPSQMDCKRCAFLAPCLAKMDGSDYQWMLNDAFHVREPSVV